MVKKCKHNLVRVDPNSLNFWKKCSKCNYCYNILSGRYLYDKEGWNSIENSAYRNQIYGILCGVALILLVILVCGIKMPVSLFFIIVFSSILFSFVLKKFS